LESIVEHINRAERWVEIQDLGPDGGIREIFQGGFSCLESRGGIVDIVDVAKSIRPQVDCDC
jgi:hypothetical protein